MGTWAWEAATLEGAPRGGCVPRSAAVTRRLNGPCGLELELDGASSAAVPDSATILRGWRRPNEGGSRTLRAAVKVAQIAAEAVTDRLEVARIAGTDGVGVLDGRIVQATATYSADTPAQIIADRISVQNARADTGLAAAVIGAGGPPRDRTYDVGKREGEILQQLAEVDDGFYYRVDPLDDGATFSELVLLYPDPGGASGARLGWGAGTDGNLSGAAGELRPPTNSIMGLGAGDGDEQLRTVVADAASIAALGLFDGTVSHPDVIESATLEGHARDALRPLEPRLFRVSVAAPMGASRLYVPEPWVDFDVGDTLELNLRGQTAALQYQGPALVTAYTVTIDADGVERIMTLDLAELGA